MSSNIELTIIQIIIMIVLFCIIILLLRQRKAIEYERRIARYSISPLEYKDKSFADIVYDKYYKEVTKLSKILNRSKFITKKSLKYEKYLGYLPNFEVIDFISNKIIISIIYIIITIFSITLQTRVVTILELIINLTIGYYLLDIYLYYRQKYMKKVIEKQVLKAVIVMNNAFKAGKSTMQAIYIASQELAPPLNYEFKRMYNEMQYGLSIDVVFDRLSKRVDNEAIQYLASSLIILNKTGGNIIKVFSSIERTLFDNQKLNEELKNLTASSNIIVKILLCIPFIFTFLIFILSPTYFNPLFESSLGHVVILLIILIFISYIWFLQKIMKVKV
ncbi:MAG: type II secretion system F family protein [Tenericutes bacterium]|nr:type II secretion system F family protein [Mycoplasmatota bacterium]